MKPKILLTFVIGLFLTACSTASPIATPEQLAGADYGKYPDNYEQVLKGHYGRTLIDPYSAQYRFPEKPYKGYSRTAPVAGGVPNQFGYVATACVNAKNRFGGYVGEKCERFLIRNGVVVTQFHDMTPFFQEPWYR